MKAVKKMNPRGKASLVGCEPSSPISARSSSSRRIDREERHAMRVQRWNEDRILDIPGVVAMGVGRTASGPQEAVLKVLVENPEHANMNAIPDVIEGVPVEIEVSGPFRALNCPSEELPMRPRGGLAVRRSR
jgi:hypothetical protein